MAQDLTSSDFLQRRARVRQRVDFDLAYVQRWLDVLEHGQCGAAVRQRRIDIEEKGEFIGENERREEWTAIVDDTTRVQQRGRIENIEKVIPFDTLKDGN